MSSDNQAVYWVKRLDWELVSSIGTRVVLGGGKTTYLLSAHFCYGNGYLESYPDLT
jgi:hypothetical protein